MTDTSKDTPAASLDELVARLPNAETLRYTADCLEFAKWIGLTPSENIDRGFAINALRICALLKERAGQAAVPVAWRWRDTDDDTWYYQDDKPLFESGEQAIAEPLYAAAPLPPATAPDVEALRSALEAARDNLDYRLNEYLCDMSEGWDDSVVGFNEAWDVVRKFFTERLAALASTAAPDTARSRALDEAAKIAESWFVSEIRNGDLTDAQLNDLLNGIGKNIAHAIRAAAPDARSQSGGRG